jgi:hypothetical protein
VTEAELAALARTHDWFEWNSGWAPPDPHTLGDWEAEASSRAPDECWVALRGICPHGLASWHLVLEALADHDARFTFPTGDDA